MGEQKEHLFRQGSSIVRTSKGDVAVFYSFTRVWCFVRYTRLNNFIIHQQCLFQTCIFPVFVSILEPEIMWKLTVGKRPGRTVQNLKIQSSCKIYKTYSLEEPSEL